MFHYLFISCAKIKHGGTSIGKEMEGERERRESILYVPHPARKIQEYCVTVDGIGGWVGGRSNKIKNIVLILSPQIDPFIHSNQKKRQ